MAKWKDVTTYSQGEALRIKTPRVWDLQEVPARVRVTVHRLYYCPGKWFLSCHDFGVKELELKSNDLASAQDEAIKLLSDYTGRIHEFLKTL